MRYDKYDPMSGGFRAPLLADRAKTVDVVGGAAPGIGVGLDNQGRIVPGAGNTGVIAMLCLTSDKKAGDVVDNMTDGEVVEFGGVAGTVYYADNATGVISAGAAVGKTRIGETVEAGHLIVRVDRGAAAAATDVVGDQAAIADVATADAVDLATAEALANALKAKMNVLLAELRLAGVIAP